MKRREQPADTSGLRGQMAAKRRERAERSRDPGIRRHYERLAERWASREPMVVYRWELPAGYLPPAAALGEHNALYEVDADGGLTRLRAVHDGAEIHYQRWVEQNAEPDPRRA